MDIQEIQTLGTSSSVPPADSARETLLNEETEAGEYHTDHTYSSENAKVCPVTMELKRKIRNLQRIAKQQKYRIEKMKQYVKRLKEKNKAFSSRTTEWLHLFKVHGTVVKRQYKKNSQTEVRMLLLPKPLGLNPGKGQRIIYPASWSYTPRIPAKKRKSATLTEPRQMRSCSKISDSGPEKGKPASPVTSGIEKNQEKAGGLDGNQEKAGGLDGNQERAGVFIPGTVDCSQGFKILSNRLKSTNPTEPRQLRSHTKKTDAGLVKEKTAELGPDHDRTAIVFIAGQ